MASVPYILFRPVSKLFLRKSEFIVNNYLGGIGKRLNSSIKTVDYKIVKKLSLAENKNNYIIDVRGAEEYKTVGSIPTSLNIPFNKVRRALGPERPAQCFEDVYCRQKPGARSHLVFTCRTGKRAHDAATIAVNLGYKDVSHYAGSFNDWKEKEKEALEESKNKKKTCD